MKFCVKFIKEIVLNIRSIKVSEGGIKEEGKWICFLKDWNED